MKRLGGPLAALLLGAISAGAAEPAELPALEPEARQQLDAARRLIIVRTKDWPSQSGQLSLFERTGATWKRVLGPLPANVGKGGLGWGRGLTLPASDTADPVKAEGDGRAPAGIFRLGQVWGYAAEAPTGLALEYRQSSARSYCVDDPRAPLYNQLVTLEEGKPKAWSSAEELLRKDGLYELLLAVDHNGLVTSGAHPGAGSCIFLHVWRAAGRPTVGCTSLSLESLRKVLTNLSAKDAALLVQLPEASYTRAVTAWGLPP